MLKEIREEFIGMVFSPESWDAGDFECRQPDGELIWGDTWMGDYYKYRFDIGLDEDSRIVKIGRLTIDKLRSYDFARSTWSHPRPTQDDYDEMRERLSYATWEYEEDDEE